MYAHERDERRYPKLYNSTLEGESSITRNSGDVKENLWPQIIMPPPNASGMEAYLLKRRVSLYVAKFNGWYASMNAGDTYIRVVIPCTMTPRGRFWQARLIDQPGGLDGAVYPKRYQSPHGPREDAICRVYAPHRGSGKAGIGDPGTVVVVEGPFCAAVAANYGHDAVALLGNSPSEAVLNHLARVITEYDRVVFIADSDSIDAMGKVMIGVSAVRPSMLTTTRPDKDLADASTERREAIMRCLE